MSTDLFSTLIMNHTLRALDKSIAKVPQGPQQPMPGTPALVERPSPCADTGTAGVSDSYPVTCAARYYDAASKILEDELQLAGNPHDNCNELGALIQQWIHDARDNWEPL